MLMSVFAAVLPLLTLIALGYGLRRTVFTSQIVWDAVDWLAYYILVPVLITTTLVKAGLDGSIFGPLGLTYFSANIVLFAAFLVVYVTARNLRDNRSSYSTLVQTSTRWNVPIGLFIANSAFGDQVISIAAIVMIVSIPLINIFNITFMQWSLGGRSKRSLYPLSMMLLGNPIILACIAGVTVAALDLTLWVSVIRAAEITGGLAPVAMLASVGAGLFGYKHSQSHGFATAACLTKLFILPFLVMGLGVLFEVQPEVLVIAIVLAATPTAPNGYAMARQLGGDAGLYSSIFIIQTIAAVITFPAWVLFSVWILG